MTNNESIFISYSSKDKNYANAICNYLEKNKIKCWIAPRDIIPGVEYGEAIIDAIHRSKIVILILTSHSNSSKFVTKEVERAVSKGAIILPIRLEDIQPTKTMEFFLSSAHWLDALSPPIEIHLKKLSDTVEYLFNKTEEIFSEPLGKITEKDRQDIKMFNEIAPADWYGNSNNRVRKFIKNLFADKT
ncbi:MAG: hypothetical protein JWQ09_4560 [Segetibacter sp.]|nr:hypothetical protein [Segetibacter sp.]